MKRHLLLKILAALGFIGTIVVNYLANALPINGVTTGEASDANGNLFAPAGITFSIWGLIYLLLLGYTIYQFGVGRKNAHPERAKMIATINTYFLITSIANISWIFAWHYGVLWLSVLLMLTLLYFLIKIADVVNKQSFSSRDNLFIRLPFSVYFGWITVATIANITAFLVSIGWNGFGISEPVWTCIILLVGAAIGIWRMREDKNSAYGLVLVWAYGGILYKHLSTSGFDGSYPFVIATTVLSVIVFAFFVGRIFLKKAA
jgi:hypothetical protein